MAEPRSQSPEGVLSRAAAWLVAHPGPASAAAALLAQVNTLANQPVLDDGWVIFENPLVRNLANLARILRDPYNVAGAATNAGLWRPLTTFTYALNYAVGGPAVGGFHAVNALLHVAVTVLVVALARRVVGAVAPGRAPVAALSAGLLFALHPVHVEAVAGLVGRAELLAALFSLAAILLAATRERATWRLPAAAGAVALGMLSKENAAVTPLLVALLALVVPSAVGLPARPGAAPGAPRAALRSLSVVLAALGAGVALPLLLRPGGVGVSGTAAWFAGQPPGVVAATMSRALAEYLRLLVWPHPLAVDFYYSTRIPFTPWGAPSSLLAAAAWGAVLATGILSWRMAPVRAAGILWVFVALLPVSNLIPTGVLMAERLLYLPSVGFCLWAGHGFAWALESAATAGAAHRARPRALVAAGVAVLLACGFQVLRRNRDWRDMRSLWEAEVVNTPRDPVVNNNLAVALTGAGEYARSRERLAVVLEVAPLYWRAWVNLGILEQRTGKLEAALRDFQRASEIDPGASSPHLFAGMALADAGRLAEAEARFAAAVRLAPEDFWARYRHGDVLARLGRRAEARDEFRRALALDPRSEDARRRLAEVEGPGVVDSPPAAPATGTPPR